MPSLAIILTKWYNNPNYLERIFHLMNQKSQDILKLTIAGLASLGFIGIGVQQHVSAQHNLEYDQKLVPTLKQSIKQTQASIDKTKAKNDALAKQQANNSQQSVTDKQNEVKGDIQKANTFALAYVDALQKVQSSKDIKAINDSFLANDARFADPDHMFDVKSVKVFGKYDKNKTHAVSNIPHDNKILVRITSDDTPEVTYLITYDLQINKISQTDTYSTVNKK